MNPLKLMSLLKSFNQALPSQEQIGELLSVAGLNVTFASLTAEQRETAFRMAAVAAVEPNSTVVSIRGHDREGNMIEGLLVVANGVKSLPSPQKTFDKETNLIYKPN